MANKYEHIQIGDTVRITRYKIGIMTENPVDDDAKIGKLCIVTQVDTVLYRSGYPDYTAYTLRYCEPPHEWGVYPFCQVRSGSRHQEMELVTKGNGTCTPGVDYQFTKGELFEQRWDAFLEQHAKMDYTYEGWTNAATWLAAFLITNNQGALEAVYRMRRKDGTVNAKKIQKLFVDRRFVLEAWTLECKLEVPQEFKGRYIPDLPRVNWQEIADDFAAVKK